MEQIYVVLAVVNIPVYIFIGYYIFGSWEDFLDSMRLWFKPDMWSWADGEYWEDMVAEFKLGILIILSVAAVVAEGQLLLAMA